MVGLLGPQDRVAIVERTLQVSEGYGPWGAVLGEVIGGWVRGDKRRRGAWVGLAKQEGVRGHSGAYRQLTHSVFMAVPQARFLPGKSAKNKVV